MNDTAVVTLVVVSAALVVFLILFSVALGYLISILKQIKRITDKAEDVAISVESAAAAIESKASSLAAIKVIGNIIEQVSKFKGRKD